MHARYQPLNAADICITSWHIKSIDYMYSNVSEAGQVKLSETPLLHTQTLFYITMRRAGLRGGTC